MIFDTENLFSDAQLIDETQSSENVVDLGADRDIGKGTPVPLLIQVVEDFDNLTSLEFQIRTASSLSSGSLSSPTTLVAMSVNLADLVDGYKTPVIYVPLGAERYMDINYAVTGTDPSAGNVTAGIVMGVQAGFE